MINLMRCIEDGHPYSTVELAFSNGDVEILQAILDYMECKNELDIREKKLIEVLGLNVDSN